MGQAALTIDGSGPCQHCTEWGDKDLATVKVDTHALQRCATKSPRGTPRDLPRQSLLGHTPAEPSTGFDQPHQSSRGSNVSGGAWLDKENVMPTPADPTPPCEKLPLSSRSQQASGGLWSNNENLIPQKSSVLSEKENEMVQSGSVGKDWLLQWAEEAAQHSPSKWEEDKARAIDEYERRARAERGLRENQQQRDMLRRECERKALEDEARHRAQQQREEEERTQQEKLRQQAQNERRCQEDSETRSKGAPVDSQSGAGRLRQARDDENKKRVQAWLRVNGFKNVDDIARKGFDERKCQGSCMSRGSKVRPLHAAVQDCDAAAVALLLEAGADRRLKNGRNETAMQMAQRLDKAGSHKEVIQALAVSSKYTCNR